MLYALLSNIQTQNNWKLDKVLEGNSEKTVILAY